MQIEDLGTCPQASRLSKRRVPCYSPSFLFGVLNERWCDSVETGILEVRSQFIPTASSSLHMNIESFDFGDSKDTCNSHGGWNRK